MRRYDDIFRNAFHFAAFGVAIADLDGHILQANPAFCSLLGYDESELQRLTFQEITHPDDIGRNVAERQRVLAGEIGSYCIEKRYFHKLGQVVWGRLTGSLVRDEAQAPLYFITQVEDITARKALEEERRRLLAILESTPDAVFVSDAACNFTYMNQGARRMIGITADEPCAKVPYATMCGADQARRLHEEILPTAARTGWWRGESIFAARDGREVPVLQTVVAHRDAEGAVAFYSTVAHDMTELKQLEQQRRLAAVVFESTREGMLVTDAEGRIAMVNCAFTNMTGYEPEEALGRPFNELLHAGDDNEPIRHEIERALALQGHWDGELVNLAKDGSSYFQSEHVGAVLDNHGELLNLVATFSDVTERRQSEEVVKQDRDFSEAVLSSLPGAFYLIDGNGRFRRWNRHLLDVAGYTDSHMAALSPLDFFDVSEHEAISESIRRVFLNGSARIEARLRTRDGQLIPYLFTGYRALLGGETMLVGMGINISERVRLERELEQMSITDSLTGLSNRRHFEQRLEQEMREAARYGRPFSVCMFDIDHFKLVNDTHGHHAGDEVLAGIAALARQGCRNSDLVARWGGEEFTLLSPETRLKGLHVLAEGLRQRIAEHSFASGVRATASFGLTEFRAGDTPERLLQRADQALYRAKERGRNRVETWTESSPDAIAQPI